ncbi:zinc finger protein 708-like [Pieris brassicae]|uniref:zinc finger protein 708-like n=1 Tax=Pieris brassicae TaxID=7116 RepID=UPI001E660E81|nr:zinc finger protein 708-like [Pieris brassicae]
MNTLNPKSNVRCIGCLCEESVSTFKVKSELLRVVFQEDSLILCFICKKLAYNADLFVRTVHTNQLRLQSLTNGLDITDLKIETHPILQLQTKIIDVDSHEIDELTSSIEQTSNIGVKLEKNDEVCDEIQDGSDNNTECDLPLVKEEDVNGIKGELSFLEDETIKKCKKIVMKTKTAKKKVKPFRENIDNTTDETPNIILVNITTEDFMSEREEMAKKNLYMAAKYKCKDCIKGFIYKEIYDKHMKLHLKSNGKYMCEICKQRMDSVEKLARHKKKHLIRYKCQECGIIRNNHSTIKDHYTSVHNKQNVLYQCPDCSREFLTSGALRRHKHYRHKKNRITCDICLKSYVTKYYLRKHIQLQHSGDNSFSKWQESRCNYKCEECGKAFSAPSQLKNHMIKHSDTRSFYCVECNKTFKTEISLNQHLKTLPHVEYSELPLQCDQCDKRFRAKRDLANHMNRIHLGTKPYQCDKCEKGYADQWSLTEHIRYKHEGVVKPRKYPCTICDKVFKTNSTCKMHIRTHTGERPYKCTKCPASFSQSGILNTHVKLVHLKLTRDGRPKVSAIDKSRYDYN